MAALPKTFSGTSSIFAFMTRCLGAQRQIKHAFFLNYALFTVTL